MKRALALGLFASLAMGEGGPHDMHTRETSRLGRSGVIMQPVFRFAPPSGAGMTEECACVNPTGTKGEVLTLSRASAATCTRGPTASGIVDGALSYCDADEARVMRGGTGVGSKGILVETARTNIVLRSQELDNASWANTGAAPVIRVDHGIAPDGTQTAEAIEFQAVADGSESGRFQLGLGTSNPGVCSMYLKAAPPAGGGPAVSGSIDMTTNATADPCVTCSFNPDTWTRCELTGVIATYLFIGNEPIGVCAAGGRTAQNVYVWGVQCEAGDFMSSYIPTEGTTVARVQEDASFTLATTQNSASGISMSGKWTSRGFPAGAAGISGPVTIGTNASNYFRNAVVTNGTVGNCGYISTGQNGTSAATSTLDASGGDNRKDCLWWGDIKRRQSIYNGVIGSTGTSASASYWDWNVVKLQGEYTDATLTADRRRPNGVVKEVCVNNAPNKCQNY